MFIFSLHRRWLRHCPGTWARLGGAQHVGGRRISGCSWQVGHRPHSCCTSGGAGTRHRQGHRRAVGSQSRTRCTGRAGRQQELSPPGLPSLPVSPQDCVTRPTPHSMPVSCVPTPVSPCCRGSTSPSASLVQPIRVHIPISQGLCPPCTHPHDCAPHAP